MTNLTNTINREKTVEDQVADAYDRYRRKLHPDWTPSLSNEGIWNKVVSVIENINADPRLYIEAQFELGYARKGESAIYIKSLHKPAAVEIYNEYRANFQSIPDRMVDEEMRRLAAAIRYGGMTRDNALANRTVQFSSWFRVLACTDENFPQIKAKYLESALVSLMRDPDLTQYIKTHFNDKFVTRLWTAIPGPSGNAHHPLPAPSFPDRFRSNLGR